MSRHDQALEVDARKSKAELLADLAILRNRLTELERARGVETKASPDGLFEEMQRIYRDSPVGLCYLDTDLRFVHINDWMARINGIPAEEHLGQRIAELIPDVAAGVEAQFRQVIDTGEPIVGGTVEAETPARPGIKRYFRHSYHPVRSDDGDVIGISCVVEDVTDRDEALEALRRAQDALLRKERLAVLGQLTGTVAHELRNPLGALSSSLNVVRRRCLAEGLDLERALGRAERSIDRCDAIITELLDFARGKGPQPEPRVLDTWLASVLEEQNIPESVTLDCDVHTDGRNVFFDPDTLCRAVVNVIDNACHAMTIGSDEKSAKRERVLAIATRVNGERVEIDITDTGPGIPEDILPQVLEPLFSTKSFGVGLGLPIVQRIMEEHDGGLTIQNKEGWGAQVVLWFPARDGGEEDPKG